MEETEQRTQSAPKHQRIHEGFTLRRRSRSNTVSKPFCTADFLASIAPPIKATPAAAAVLSGIAVTSPKSRVPVLLLLGAANLFRTRIGRAFIAIRDRDISAEVLGIPLLRYKLLSFAISSFYAGVAGGLFAYFFRAITPESFPLVMSIFFLAAVIVGGMGSVLGGVLGALFMTLVPEILKLVMGWLPLSGNTLMYLSPVRTIVFGALIILFLVFEPLGLAEVWRRIRRAFHLWPFRT